MYFGDIVYFDHVIALKCSDSSNGTRKTRCENRQVLQCICKHNI